MTGVFRGVNSAEVLAASYTDVSTPVPKKFTGRNSNSQMKSAMDDLGDFVLRHFQKAPV
jgi:hypothetical protein